MVSEMIHNAMNEYSHLSALKIGGRNVTYNSLNKVSLQIASFLLSEEIQKNNIGILGQRNYSVYTGILGSIYSGNAYVPINKKYPERKIKDIIEDADIKVLICSEKDWSHFKSILSSINTIKFVLIPEGDTFKSENRVKTASDLNNVDVITEPVSVKPSDNLYVMFTSGSTGKPKGVQVMNSNVASLIKSLDPVYVIDPGYNSSQSFDLSFDPSICDMFLTWYKGGKLCVLNEEDIYCPSDYILREKIDFWHSVPTIANNLSKLGYLEPDSFPNIKYSIFVGEPFSLKLANEWSNAAPNSRVENRYGPTELTVDVTQHIFSENDNSKNYNNGILPIGQAFTNQKLIIVNESDKIIFENKKSGELVVSGPQVTKGYLNDNKKTDQSFVKFEWDHENHLWYRTGDLVFLNEDNRFEMIGRIDKQVKIGGRRIELGEIEYVLKKYGKVDEVVIIAKKNMNGVVERLVAFTTKNFTDNEINIVQKDCEKYLERIFFPQEFRYIETMPITISGKIDKPTLEKYTS